MKKEKRTGFGIIGLGRFGMALARSLGTAGAEVLVIDEDDNKIRQIRGSVQEAFIMGKLTREALEETGIKDCDTVVVCIGEKIDVSMLTTLNVLQLGVPRVIAKADSKEHGIILERIGAEVVFPERETATRLASVLLGSKALDLMRLNDDFVISEIKVPQRFAGKHVKDLDAERYNLRLLVLEREPNITLIQFSEDDLLSTNDAIVVVGKFADVDRFEQNVMMEKQ